MFLPHDRQLVIMNHSFLLQNLNLGRSTTIFILEKIILYLSWQSRVNENAVELE